MGIYDFNSIFSTLYQLNCKRPPSDLTYERHNTIRALDFLGHCEFDFEDRKVYVCPPLLVTLPTWGLPRAVLTGARSPSLVGNLKQSVRINRESARLIRNQHNSYLVIPEAIIVECSNAETIDEIAKSSKIAYSKSVSAWEIANFASGVDEMINSSIFEEKAELNWKSRIFSSEHMQFLNRTEKQDEVRLVEYTNPLTQQRVHWLWNGSVAAQVDRDLGRYKALAESGVKVLVYDKLHNFLSVPDYVPLPILFARAIALCSGIMPARAVVSADNKLGLPSNLPVKIFSDVPPEIVDVLSHKLSQTPIIRDITLNKNGEIL